MQEPQLKDCPTMLSSDPSGRKPVPARLVLLDQVHQQESGSKIRFLGCVYAYYGDSATVTMRSDFTKESSVQVNIKQILESANHELLAVGTWLNVIGYVKMPSISAGLRQPQNATKTKRKARSKVPVVDAVMLWNAGAIRLEQYQSAVRDYQKSSLQDST